MDKCYLVQSKAKKPKEDKGPKPPVYAEGTGIGCLLLGFGNKHAIRNNNTMSSPKHISRSKGRARSGKNRSSSGNH